MTESKVTMYFYVGFRDNKHVNLLEQVEQLLFGIDVELGADVLDVGGDDVCIRRSRRMLVTTLQRYTR